MCLMDSAGASWEKSGPPWALGVELEGPQSLPWAFCHYCQILSSLYPMLWKWVLSLALGLILAQSNVIEAGSRELVDVILKNLKVGETIFVLVNV